MGWVFGQDWCGGHGQPPPALSHRMRWGRDVPVLVPVLTFYSALLALITLSSVLMQLEKGCASIKYL